MGSIVETRKSGRNGKEYTQYRAHVRRQGFAPKSKVFRSKREAQDWLRNNESDATLKKAGRASALTTC